MNTCESPRHMLGWASDHERRILLALEILQREDKELALFGALVAPKAMKRSFNIVVFQRVNGVMRMVPLKLVYYYADLVRHRAGPRRNIPAVLVHRERTDDQIRDDLEGIFFLLLFSNLRFGEVLFQGREWPDPKYPLREARHVLINREREREAQQEMRSCR